MSRHSRRTVPQVLGWSLVLLAAGSAAGLGQAGRFDEVTEVVLVEVPVQVLKDGEPVRGLTAADFEILDGRKKQEIVGFELVDLSVTDAFRMPTSTLAAAARRHFLFLFDLTFSDPATVVRAREAAIELVTSGLHGNDLAAVATYSRLEGVRLLLGFSSDKAQVKLAIETLGLPQLVETRRDPLGVTFTDLDEGVISGGPGAGVGQLGFDPGAEILDYLQTLESGVRRAADRNEILALTSAMGGLAEMMRSVDGRKYVVYLSEGFDSSILLGRGVTTAEDQERIEEQNRAVGEGRIWDVDSNERFGDTSTQNQLSLMLDEFVRADCTIQAVDIGGLRAGADVRPRAASEDGLFIMASNTGGELYRNFNNLNAAMGEMLQRTSVTYLLAFQPQELKYDGQFHRLKVKLKNGPKGARLVHRPGYFAPKSFGEMSGIERQLTSASRIFGAAGGPIDVSVLAAPFHVGQARAYVPVLIEIDGPSLLAGHQSNLVPAEIYAYAIAADGRVQDFFTQAMGLDLSKVGAALRQSGFKFWGQFDLPSGSYTARVLVRNSESGKTGVEVFPFKVPEFDQGEVALLPPLFPEPQGKWLLGREQGTAQADYPYPFTSRNAPFIPAAEPLLRSGQATEISLVAYNFEGLSPEVQATLYAADGSRLGEVEIILNERSRGVDPGMVRYVATCGVPALEAGSYRLEITLRDSAGGSEQTSSIRVRLTG